MTEYTDFSTLPDSIRAFPEVADVFSPEQPWLAKHLLPLLSIDLGVLRPELAGTVVHMLNPIEPEDGCIGQYTSAHHTEWVRENWLAFRLTDDNRYEFLADEGYFLYADATQDWPDSAQQHVADMRNSYAAAKAHWQQHGVLAQYSWGEWQQYDYLDALGGPLWGGNWASSSHYVPSACTLARDDSDEGICTITHQGRPFFQVAHVAGYNWCKYGADAIILLYEPVNRIALFTFDWS